MKVLFVKYKHLIVTGIVLVLMLALVLRPQIYMQSVLNGILLWGTAVLPALFPFFFFSGLLIKMKAVDKLGAFFSKFTEKLFHCPGSSGVIYILSIISGYPVGAKIASEMYKQGALTSAQVMRVNAFASTSGPLFIVGSVGVGMFVSHTCGLIILISHFIGALLNGLLYRNYGYKQEKLNSTFTLNKGTQDILSTTMYDSIISILLVGGYIAIFFIVIDVLFNCGILSLLGAGIGKILSILGLPEMMSTGLASGIFEVTRGCLDLSKSGVNLQILTPFACALISWGGISIHLQALTFLNKCNINTGVYFLQKFTQSIISGLVALVFVLIFPIK